MNQSFGLKKLCVQDMSHGGFLNPLDLKTKTTRRFFRYIPQKGPVYFFNVNIVCWCMLHMFPCKSSDLKCWISRGCFFFPEYEFSNSSNWKNLCAMSRQVLDVMLYSCRISCMTSCFLGSRIWKGCFQNFNKDQHQTIFAGHFGDLNYFRNVNVSLSFCGFYVYTHILFL